MAIRAGRYRERMKVLKPSGTKNQFGGLTSDKELVQSPWCKVRFISDNENDGEQTVSQTILEFEMRYSKSLENPSSGMFIEYRGKEYDIVSIENQELRNEKLIIMGKLRR